MPARDTPWVFASPGPASPWPAVTRGCPVFVFQLKAQVPGSAEELRCLQVLNRQQEGSSLEELISNQSCLKLANTIKAYVATVSPDPPALGIGGGWGSRWESSCLPPCLSFPIGLAAGGVAEGDGRGGLRGERRRGLQRGAGGGAQPESQGHEGEEEELERGERLRHL